MPVDKHDDKPIFPPWEVDRWTDVDDRVRGGSSVSHLDLVDLESGKGKGVRFWGHLDIDTLGGAGFASQRYRFGPEPLTLPPLTYRGITLLIHPEPSSSGQKKTASSFTLVLKSTLPTRPPSKPKTPPSPDPASLSYEFTFPAPFPSHPKTLHLPFDRFKATYRGREVEKTDPKYVPLDTTRIYEVSFMCRSAFGEQSGDFGIVFAGVQGWKREKEGKEVGLVRRVWEGVVAAWTGLMVWVKSWFVGGGQIALSDEEKEPLV